jgi:hypothetical protein
MSKVTTYYFTQLFRTLLHTVATTSHNLLYSTTPLLVQGATFQFCKPIWVQTYKRIPAARLSFHMLFAAKLSFQEGSSVG